MKPKYRINIVIQLVCSTLFLLYSCDNDIQVVDPGKTIPVIYGILNPDDSISYVRLTKSFVGDTSATILAKDPSNLYYDSATVSLDINTPEGYPISSLVFNREQIGDREPGLLLTSPNLIYTLRKPVNQLCPEGCQLRLVVRIWPEDEIISAQQIYITPPEILSPRTSKQTRLSLYGGEPTRIKWVDKFGFQKYVLIIRFNYIERFINHQDTVTYDQEFTKDSQKTMPGSTTGNILHIFEGDMFLKKIGSSLKSSDGLVNRSFVSIDIVICCLSKAFCDYTETNAIAADRLGKPVSNIVGGMGVFTYKAQAQQKGYLMDPVSLDSLVKGQYTKLLKFVKW